jgi:hypothetical protein
LGIIWKKKYPPILLNNVGLKKSVLYGKNYGITAFKVVQESVPMNGRLELEEILE